MKIVLQTILLAALLSSCSTTYYYVVRHAEKQDNSNNPPISSAGQQRAIALRDLLINKGIDSIYTTQFLRTQQTAQPLATALSKSLNVLSADFTNLLLRRLKKLNGKDVLVVNHSNLVPQIVFALSGETVPAITEQQFSNLYIIKVEKGLVNHKTLQHTSYGAP